VKKNQAKVRIKGMKVTDPKSWGEKAFAERVREKRIAPLIQRGKVGKNKLGG